MDTVLASASPYLAFIGVLLGIIFTSVWIKTDVVKNSQRCDQNEKEIGELKTDMKDLMSKVNDIHLTVVKKQDD